MPEPLAICIELVGDEPTSDKYLRCVAIPGRVPGLAIDKRGRVLWKTSEDLACELWVTGDDQLALYRPEGAAAPRVQRAGRSIEAPHSKPVILRDGDELFLGDRHLRVHIHGVAKRVHEPSPLPQRAAAGLAIAAAVVLSATAAGCKTGQGDVRDPPPIDVRSMPPQVPAVPSPDDAAPPVAPPDAADAPEASAAVPPASTPDAAPPVRDAGVDAGKTKKKGTSVPPIEVRERPPDISN